MYHWSKLSGINWVDAWEERFYGNPNAVISEIKGGKSVRVEVYCDTKKAAEVIKEQWGGSIRKLKEQNWVAMSAVESPPLKIRDAILVTGSTDAKFVAELRANNPKKHVIQVPAEMAFGTGDHATTSTCLRFLVDIGKERRGESWEMLDLGCGTALLAIAARLLGAEKCEAHDFDHHAVRVSEQNLVLNGVDKIDVRQQDVLEWTPPRQWPVVVANMFSTILQKAFPTIAASVESGGEIIISGILADQWQPTKATAESAGLKFHEVVKKGKWVTARGRKSF